MPSLIPGYEYDIFISYRQKDNKHDGWVTGFVDNLKGELESTFKEEISVYFDINPHDGLLETHDVDASLKDKLKCLIFIPIISRTYCDPKSFAWEHEFKAFVEIASQDQFGLKVKLPHGNVANRVLPIQIHDLDSRDNQECEAALGGALRGIEFIYKEQGVNRPLRSNEENPKNNLNHTIYCNQINKVSLAIKEIVIGLRKEPSVPASELIEIVSQTDKPVRQEKSIAVLPFVDMSPERDQGYFCEGMAEEIINVLAHIENLKVIARTSAFAFKDKQTDIREIGRILDVETLLEGSIRKADNRLRVTAQLIRVADGTHIWSERYDREMKDVFAIQDEISLAIAENLKIKLLGESRALITIQHSEDLEAYSLYLKGTYWWQMGALEGYNKASEYFEQALHKDPGYTLAYCGLAAANIMGTTFGDVSPDEAYPKAIEYANKALKIDNAIAEAYWILGSVNTFYNWNWKEAELNFNKAIRINPNSSLIHIFYSFMLTFTGRNEKAIVEAKRAQELDPLSGFINTYTGVTYQWAGQRERAIEEHQMILAMYPNYFLAHYHLGLAYRLKAMYNEAAVEYKKAADLSNGSPFAIACLVIQYYRIGERDQAEKLLAGIKKRSVTEYVPATSFYLIYASLGKEELALEWLRRACNEHDTMLPWLSTNAQLIPDGSKYMALLKERGL